MASTKPRPAQRLATGLARGRLALFRCEFHLRQRFGARVQKVSVDAGFTCPNVDGSVATGGCTFCDNRSFSPSRRLPRAGIRGQIDQSLARMKLRYRKCRDFLAYFQPATNTYAPVERLRPLYEEALSHPQVVGLVIGTRPDCVPDDVLELMEELAGRTYRRRRVRHADDARPLARLDEPRPSPRRDARRRSSAAAGAASKSVPT